jgi:diguanylate cyclase (GGDEF)-like protein
VTKPFDPYELQARLRTGRRIIELQEQLLSAREALRDQASRDPLTDLWNHKAILGILRKEVARASRTQSPLAVAMIDVDRFKAINDTYGHLAGDAVLRETARRLRGAMRTYDSLGRYGGDEFLAVFPGCDPTGAARFAESFRARIDRKAIDTPDGLIPVALTLGVAAVEDLLNVRPEALVRVADAALYRAKIAGRNRVALATPEDIAGELSKQFVQEDKDDPDDLFPDLPSSPPPM